MSQRTVATIHESGYRYTIVRCDDDRYTPYRVYLWRDKWHKRRIGKEGDILLAIRIICDHMMNGG